MNIETPFIPDTVPLSYQEMLAELREEIDAYKDLVGLMPRRLETRYDDGLFEVTDAEGEVFAWARTRESAAFIEMAPRILTRTLSDLDAALTALDSQVQAHMEKDVVLLRLAWTAKDRHLANSLLDGLYPCPCACHPQGPCPDCAEYHSAL